MTIAREKYIKIITDKLAYLSSLIKMRNASNLTDISIILEQDFCGLLNLLYDYELVDMNRNGNYPVIDLADLRNRIAVQITAQKKRHKIVKTIHDFIEQKFFVNYDRLIIIVLGTKPKYDKEFDTKGIFSFSKEKDIIDFNQILKDIMMCEIEKLEKLADYMNSHIILSENRVIKHLTDPPSNNCTFYCGRSGEEKEILKWLKINKSRTYVISGTGGIGKTELAKRIWGYMSKQGGEYGIYHLAWVPYQGSDLKLSICQSFLDLKYKKNKDAAWANANDFFAKEGESFLLFVDNIEKSTNEDRILNSLEQYRFRTILTTREKLNNGEAGVSLESLSRQDCRELFYKFYTLEKSDDTVDSILKKAGRLTVVIELLAKAAEIERLCLADLESALLKHGFDISEEYVSTNHDLLTKEDKIAEQIKKLFSIVACTDEQIKLLAKIAMFPAKEFSFENAQKWFGEKRRTPLNNLVKRGWLRLQENSNEENRYWMHPVLAASIRMQTSDIVHETCKQIIHTFTEILSAEKNDDIFERFLLMPFAESFQMYMQKYFNNKNDIKFINALGNMYIEMAEYKQAIDLYNSALNIVQNNSELKEYSVELSRELGNAYKQYGDFASARKYYTATITSVSSQSECKAENKITVYRDMGHLYKSEGDYDKALHYYNWAEKIYYQAKKENPQLSEKYLAKIYYGKGNVYRCAENFEESKKHYELARNIYKDKVDESSFEWMLTYDNIGVCWFRLGYYDKALAYHEKALELQKKTYKNIKQPFMGLSYMYRGDVYMAQKKEETAYKDYQTAFYIIQNSVGDYHPYMIRVKNHMARYFLSQNDYEQAECIERGALDFENTELGRVHPDTAELYNNLVEIYIRKRDKDNAVKYHNRLKAYKDTVLRSHPETLKLWMREAEYYISLGKGSKAYEKLRYLVQEASDITSKATIVEQAKRMMREKF